MTFYSSIYEAAALLAAGHDHQFSDQVHVRPTNRDVWHDQALLSTREPMTVIHASVEKISRYCLAAVLAAAMPTVFAAPNLTISKTHSGNFQPLQYNVWSIAVTNIGSGPTSGTISMHDSIPVGVSLAAYSWQQGWDCSVSTEVNILCTTTNVIQPGDDALFTIAVNIGNNPPTSVTNTATVSGGGETDTTDDSASDTATIQTTSPVRLQTFRVD